MIPGMNITPQHLEHATRIAQNGSPMLLQAVGRVFGLGQTERSALGVGGIPTWFWATIALGIGFVGGVQVYKRWPTKVPGIIKGG